MVKKAIAVLFGGVSSEHEVSLMSATSIFNHLDRQKYEIIPVGITKSGRWLYYTGALSSVRSGAWEQGPCTPAAFCPGSGYDGLVLFEKSGVRCVHIDVVFPVLHGKNGEDGTVQGLLDLTGIPYVGCGVLGSALCMDKIIANSVMDAAGIARCEWEAMERCELLNFDAIEAGAAARLAYPMFVKPANAGSSVGISKVFCKEELRIAVELALQHDDRVLFERFVDGQEVECAVRGNDVVTSTFPGEILASKDFYNYEDKYVAGTSSTAIPALLAPETLEEVRTIATRAYRTLCCKGLARVDFFVERGTGKVLLNEINTLPGFTDISMYPKLMMDAGDSYSGLLDSLIALALQRGEARHAL